MTLFPRHDHAPILRRAFPLNDPRALCAALGLMEGAMPQGHGLLVRCPAHADRTASCSVRRGADGTVAVKCHGCDLSGDALHLVAAAKGLGLRGNCRAVLAAAAELAGVDLEVFEAPKGQRTPTHAPAASAKPRAAILSTLPSAQVPAVRAYPPADEVQALWDAACVPVLDDAEVPGRTWEDIVTTISELRAQLGATASPLVPSTFHPACDASGRAVGIVSFISPVAPKIPSLCLWRRGLYTKATP